MTLAKIKVSEIRLDPISGYPTPVEGAIFYNSNDNKTYLYNGTSWIPLT